MGKKKSSQSSSSRGCHLVEYAAQSKQHSHRHESRGADSYTHQLQGRSRSSCRSRSRSPNMRISQRSRSPVRRGAGSRVPHMQKGQHERTSASGRWRVSERSTDRSRRPDKVACTSLRGSAKETNKKTVPPDKPVLDKIQMRESAAADVVRRDESESETCKTAAPLCVQHSGAGKSEVRSREKWSGRGEDQLTTSRTSGWADTF